MRYAFLTAFLLLAPALRAGIHAADSLEWLADSSEAVVLVAVAGTTDTWKEGLEGSVWDYRTAETKPARALKGKAPGAVSVSGRLLTLSPWPLPAGRELLLFLDAQGAVRRAIDLSDPRACAADFQAPRTREAVLEAVEARLKRTIAPRAFWEEVPEETPAYKLMWSGSACYLRVPADPERLKGILKDLESKDVHVRAQAAHKLLYYPGEETVARLNPLLRDPGLSQVDRFDGKTVGHIPVYPVRQVAYETLLKLGEKPEKPEGYQDDLKPSLFYFGDWD